ncbi:helix-turn-helix transcriptional regulator [Halobium palmae]|uniref:Helix-turn-helix transcriptional regulator n=1 Tax=Halobium palmae TaxID=1776492 RepID=A0ABD5RYM0_9EURY
MSTQGAEYEVVTTVLDRFDLVDRLTDGPKEKRELTEELSVSRSTVNRAIRDLESLGLVERVEEGYRPTDLCLSTATRLSTLVESVGRETRLQEFRKWVPDGTLDADLAAASEFSVSLPEPGDPYGMVNRHVQRLREASSHRTMLPLTGLHAYEAVHDGVVDRGVSTECVAQPDVVEVLLRDPNFEPLTDAMADTGRFRLFEADGPVPYFVGVLDDVVQIGVDEEGEPRALYETADADVRAWAERTVDEWIERSTRVV